ncbi:double-cubane-cluster-containing anaerobic reductase [Calderihabitans maritimus]|uniref:2-hydroxyglutaryl-CoA dehydratase subunit D n=1 Tax=Calderihabitans maritimus TaxID=1246530 RepID=A0A1Z5HXY1_9FIRM|nr:double-cubane-cluster-containing anaerobic reductase [Calderihabitans maritimus]GAW94201.1 2-hydroxyglutaryl-CoA dehydratase subunit D [Calderihabitans maritimus]
MSDYRDLWQSLNMDLERHDLLCAALPSLYEEVYLNQPGRPQGMNYFNAVIAEIHGMRVAELAEHRKQGGKVFGTFCVFVPTEIIRAAGGVAIGLCGGSQFWVPDGEKVLPRTVCPLIKASVGAKISRTCPYFESSDMLVGETTCDDKKKAWEILNEYIPTYVMELPQMKREKDRQAWIEEVGIFKGTVEKITGKKIEREHLREAIRVENAKRKALKRLYSFRKNDPVPISGKDALLVTQIAFYDDPQRFVERTEELCSELEERVTSGYGVFKNGAPRIVIAGSPQAIPNWKLHHLIETSGAVVVCEETCTGTRYFEHLVQEEGETLEELLVNLANRYFQINCACFTPNHERVEDILRLVHEYRADGVIHYNLSFCQPYSIEAARVEKALKAKGIPCLRIETDYSEEDIEQIRTRIEAFLEVVR